MAKNRQSVKNPNWQSKTAIPGTFPSKSDFKEFSWDNLPSDSGDFYRSCQRYSSGERICTSAFFAFELVLEENGYFDTPNNGGGVRIP